jgi:hypothetical protein
VSLLTLNEKAGLMSASIVAVPDGAMEWLLHEVGHWVAASPNERKQINYGLSSSETGHDGDREWQAWAFEEIVMAPFGPARDFAAPTQRDGAGFSKIGPIPMFVMRHAEQRITDLGIDLEPWCQVYGDWIQWGKSLGLGRAPWDVDR